MNTVAKGDKLEAEVFRLFERIIDAGEFWAKKEFCRLKPKARYFSRTRETEIEFDLSVEVWLPGADRASLICPIECKNYSHSVPVNDVEEFVSKCEQVEARKGVIVSRGAFQKGAQTYAKNKAFGLIRYLADETHKWILHRSTAANVVSASADHRITLSNLITDEVCLPPIIDAVCETSNGATTSLWEFFDDLLDNPTSKEWLMIQSPIRQLGGVVPYIEANEIDDLANRASAIDGEIVGPLDLDQLCRLEHQKCDLKVRRWAEALSPTVPTNVLGRFLFEENTIELFDGHAKSPTQMRFTLAHELGHHFLGHARYLSLDTYDEDDFEGQVGHLLSLTDIARLEWQANRFAACLLMPRRQFLHQFRLLLEDHDIKDRGYGLLYVDSQPCNLETFGSICSGLSCAFRVSFGAVAVRLKVLGLLNDQRLSSPSTVIRLEENRR